MDPDPRTVVSPSDAIVGACGRIEGDRLYQVKGMDYRLADLLGDEAHGALYRDGTFVTLRLTAGVYHHSVLPTIWRSRRCATWPGTPGK